MTSEERILYRRLRDVSLRYGKNSKYKAWIKMKFPNKEPHHLFGSVFGRKCTDLAIVPVDPMEHRLKQNDLDWSYEKIPQMFDLLLRFISEQT